uniref:Uncharacterized protein n=3 Tax=Oryza TaxID=4527 RepID=A0A5S6R9Z0_ORYSJ|nr:Hypothetical protein [Oryza sativa Japonica Group]AAP52263.1 hypothetical protein LOC_Os10g08170 [Oryza sativa Japonica Group]
MDILPFLLLLLLCCPLLPHRRQRPPTAPPRRRLLHHAVVDIHPIVLLPGNGCSKFDAELTKHYKPSPWAPVPRERGRDGGSGCGRTALCSSFAHIP